MRRMLAALVLVALVLAPYQIVFENASADHGTPFPWKTFSESAQFAVGTNVGRCRVGVLEKEVLVAVLMQGETMWSYFFSPETERFVFAEFGTNGVPVRIWSGKANMTAPTHDEITISEHHAYSRERDGDGPCRMLFADNA